MCVGGFGKDPGQMVLMNGAFWADFFLTLGLMGCKYPVECVWLELCLVMVFFGESFLSDG